MTPWLSQSSLVHFLSFSISCSVPFCISQSCSNEASTRWRAASGLLLAANLSIPFYRVSHSWPAKTLVLPLVAFAILYNVPKFFELRVVVPGDSGQNGTIVDEYDIAATDLRLNSYYYKVYLMWMNFLLMGLGPFVVLVVLNALSVRELIVLSGGNNITIGPDSATNRRKDIVLAKVSMAIVFVFIVCHSIKWIPNIYELLQVTLSY